MKPLALLRAVLLFGALFVAALASAQSIQYLDSMTIAGLSHDGTTVLGQTLSQASYWTKAGGVQSIPVLGNYSIAKYSSTHGEQIVGEVATPTGTGVFWWDGKTVDIIAPSGSEGGYKLLGCDATGNSLLVDIPNVAPYVCTRTTRTFAGNFHANGMSPDGFIFGYSYGHEDGQFKNAIYQDLTGHGALLKHGTNQTGSGRHDQTSYQTVGLTADHHWFVAGGEEVYSDSHPEQGIRRTVMYTPVGDWTVGTAGQPPGVPTFPTEDGNGVLFGGAGDFYLQDIHQPLGSFRGDVRSQGIDVQITSVTGMGSDGLTFVGTCTDSTGSHSFYLQLASTIGSTNFNIAPYTANNIPAPGVLKSPLGWPLEPVLVSQPAHGTVALYTDGSFTYTPLGNFTGRDSFQVRNKAGAQAKYGTVVLHVGAPTSVTTSVSSVYGASGIAVRGRVNLNFTAKNPITIKLKSTHPEAATVPATVVVPTGSSGQTFPITTSATDADITTSIVATLDTVSATCPLKVMRNAVTKLSVPQILGSLKTLNGHIYLTGPAGPAGVHVVLSVVNGVLSVPGSVNVAAGETSAVVPITIQANMSRIVGINANGKLFPVNAIGVVKASPGTLFTPRALTISRPPAFPTTLATTVCWFNADSIPHSVTSDQPGGPNSDTQYPTGIPPGKYFYYTVDPTLPAGTYIYYHCRFKGAAGDGTHIGTGMAGNLVVK